MSRESDVPCSIFIEKGNFVRPHIVFKMAEEVKCFVTANIIFILDLF